jgi:nucleoside-diphosphate-sugar epimerase
MKRKVLVIGGAGYVGSELVPQLLKHGYSVRVFDTFWYGASALEGISDINLEIWKGDLRDIEEVERALVGVTDVIHLACISNDPSFDLNPTLGKSINLDSFRPIVMAAKKSGVQRFIFASSSSVYGVKSEERVTEELSLEPLTDYSKFKAECEDILFSLASKTFVCTVLRPATVCGVSTRQRFDLSVNILTNHAINRNLITVFGGAQQRPNLHIKDMCRAYVHVLEQETSKIENKIFNVSGENLSLDQIADKVSRSFNFTGEIVHETTDDMRSYRVDSALIKSSLGFSPAFNVEDAIQDLILAFKNGMFMDPLENSFYFNIKRMKELSLG